nr:UDP-N-acetylmuramate dehydrogenase [Azoarcus sp. KH32C]
MAVPQIRCDVDLTPFNTFGLPARASRFAVVRQAKDVAALRADPDWASGPSLVLGGGSNLVLTRDIPGLVLKVEVAGRKLVGEDRDAWYVEAGAGENWHDFVRWTLDQGRPGLENLSLIPGTVGAAPVQNIGAYGLEMAERFHSLRAVELDSGELIELDNAACRFAYRDSVFKQELAGRVLIISVTFRLPRRWQPVLGYADVARELAACGIVEPTPKQVSDAVIAVRQRKLPDPARIGNAGSFFKNPVVDAGTRARLAAAHPELPSYAQPDGRFKLAAGWLIDRSGWKGRDLGPVGAYENQALVLVNRGGARGADVERIARAIQADVLAKFGVQLEPEPVFV